MTRNHWIGGLAAVAALFVVAYVASPLAAARALQAAARDGDADRLQRLVDFPAVRDSLKGQLNAMTLKAMRDDPSFADNPFGGLALVLVPTIVDRAVDGYVTPDGLAAMLAADRPTVPAPSRLDPVPAAPAHKRRAEIGYAYRDLDTFVVSSVRKDEQAGRFNFVLHRRGVFGWRLTRVELPVALMDGVVGG